MSRCALRRARSAGMWGGLLLLGCAGKGIDLGNSGGAPMFAQTAGAPALICQEGGASNQGGLCGPIAGASADAAVPCAALTCIAPCRQTADFTNGGATGLLFCDLQGECLSALPQCHHDTDGGGAGGAVAASAGAPAGGAAATCTSGSCGVICGYFSEYPGGPTQPMVCDSNQRCATDIPVCSAGTGGS